MDMNEDNDNIIVHEGINSNEIENILSEPLAIEDLEVINSIHSSFLSIASEREELTNLGDPSEHTSELICCLQFNNKVALRLIKFCRLIDKFESMNADDRFIMIKYNLTLLFCISTCHIFKEINDCSLNTKHKEEKKTETIYNV